MESKGNSGNKFDKLQQAQTSAAEDLIEMLGGCPEEEAAEEVGAMDEAGLEQLVKPQAPRLISLDTIGTLVKAPLKIFSRG